jgi:hypothetical protein
MSDTKNEVAINDECRWATDNTNTGVEQRLVQLTKVREELQRLTRMSSFEVGLTIREIRKQLADLENQIKNPLVAPHIGGEQNADFKRA